MLILYHFINKVHHKTTRKSCGGVGLEYFHFHHETKRKSCGGGGLGMISFLPRDQKIHQKIFKCYRKVEILYHFINKFHHKTTRFSCGGVGYFRARPQDFLVVWQDIGIRTFNCIAHSHPLHKIFLRSCGELFTTKPRENVVVGAGVGIF